MQDARSLLYGVASLLDRVLGVAAITFGIILMVMGGGGDVAPRARLAGLAVVALGAALVTVARSIRRGSVWLWAVQIILLAAVVRLVWSPIYIDGTTPVIEQAAPEPDAAPQS